MGWGCCRTNGDREKVWNSALDVAQMAKGQFGYRSEKGRAEVCLPASTIRGWPPRQWAIQIAGNDPTPSNCVVMVDNTLY